MTLRMRNARPLWLLVFLSVIIALTACTVRAEEANPYRIVLTAPGGWTNNNAAVIKVSITDRGNIGWQRIEYRMNSGGWLDCEDLFDQGKGEITVHDNGSFALRVTDPSGKTYEETATVTTIDLSAPTVTAEIYNQTLRIDVRDDLSGIGGVQVNSMLFTTVEGNVLEVELDQNMNKFEKLAIRAFDFAGNFSEPVTLENPHYEKPADPTPEPTATPTAKPTKKPTATAEASEPEETVRPVQPAATETTQHGLGSSLIYITDDDIPVVPVVTAAPTAEPTAAPTPEPIIQTEYITIGPGMPYLADGNSHTLDVLYSAATNKQFITLQSKSGNTFYLVIDYDKPIDEEAEMYETYFLNLVDERDLLALMSDEEKEEVPTPTPEIIYVTPEPTAVPVPTAAPTEQEKTDKPSQMTAIIALVGIAALAIIGVVVFKKNKNGGSKMMSDNDFDLRDEDADESEQSEE
ncbi:MAG: DUF4366 domain-containing protein [Clostridia bacterium]|nr:DUF4366 domain-containing protein [Clostridia bacterium]